MADFQVHLIIVFLHLLQCLQLFFLELTQSCVYRPELDEKTSKPVANTSYLVLVF